MVFGDSGISIRSEAGLSTALDSWKPHEGNVPSGNSGSARIGVAREESPVLYIPYDLATMITLTSREQHTASSESVRSYNGKYLLECRS